MGTVLCLVVPSRERKILKTLVFSVVITVTILPFLNNENIDFDFVLPEFNESEISENSSLHLQNLLEKEIYKKVSDFLINKNINEYEIYVSTEFDEKENTVILKNIKVELGEKFKERANEIKNELSNICGSVEVE